MKQKGKRIIAVLLTSVMLCSSLTMASSAETGRTSGWRNDDGVWHYYERDTGDIRVDNFAPSSTDVPGMSTMYFLNDEGTIVRAEGGSTIEYGKVYELTADGAVKGGQLGSLDDEYGERKIWYTEPATGKLTSNMWKLLKDEDGQEYWFFFKKDENEAQMINVGYAICDTTCGINKKIYKFDENGHMAASQFAAVEDGNGEKHKAYAQLNGDFAKDKWLYIDGDWYYFENKVFDGWDGPVPVVVTGSAQIGGESYEFDEEGRLISENAPYRFAESIDISAEKDSAYIGEEVTVNVDITVASDSNATVATASNATMSNAEKKAIVNGDAYDVFIQYKGPGVSGASELSLKSDQLQWIFTPKTAGDTEIKLYVDGNLSNVLTISCKVNQDKQESPAYMEEVFSNIINADLPGEEIVQQLSDNYEGLNTEEASKLRENDGILTDLENFEKAYSAGQGGNSYVKDLDGIKEFVDPDKVSVVGAYLNADINAPESVAFSMKKDTAADISGIEGTKKIPFDITLSGGNIDSSSLKIPVTVTMPIPKGLSQDGLKLYHIHDGATSELALSASQLQKGNVRFTVSSLSTFVFVNNKTESGDNPSSGGGSSSGGSGGGSSSGGSGGTKAFTGTSAIPETPGQWKMTAGGWQFLKADGTLYGNTWIYVKGRWYWIEPSGIMASGWKELNGKRYYLRPATGEMVTGWIEDGGKWYYLDQNGCMLSSTTTPDNYRVDEKGVWIQN